MFYSKPQVNKEWWTIEEALSQRGSLFTTIHKHTRRTESVLWLEGIKEALCSQCRGKLALPSSICLFIWEQFFFLGILQIVKASPHLRAAVSNPRATDWYQDGGSFSTESHKKNKTN